MQLHALALVATLAPLAALAPACATTGEPAALHTFTSGPDGFDTNTYWLDTGSEVVVFDAQFTPALAERMLADIRATTASPVTWVVVTHPNPDKFNGAPVFQAAGAKLVASAATAAALPGVHAYKKAYFTGVGMFTDATYPALPNVDVTFSGTFDLPVAGARVHLVELAHGGVTSTQTVAVTDAGVVVGDLFANRAHAWLEGAVGGGAPRPDLAAWHAALDETLALAGDDARIFPGRGEVLMAAVAVAEQHAYLTRAEAIVRARLAAGADAGQAATHQALQAELAEAFPSHRFPYLVGYGVYGLALALAP